VFDWREADATALATRADDLLARRTDVEATIAAALPAVTARSARNYEVMEAACR
jgi:hypothetical protein